MRTYTHFLLTAVTYQHLQQRGLTAKREALLAGSVAPDVPLTLISIGYILDRRLMRPHLPDKTRCSPTYNELYFHNPWWIAAYNILHAPLPLLLLALLGILAQRQPWGRWLFWFAVGCGLHMALDVVTHADDGPVLLFPLNWHTRFRSPLSYWDPKYGGRLFRLGEHLLDLLLIAVLIEQHRQAKTNKHNSEIHHA